MFNLESKYNPSGDQPQAIEKLLNGIDNGDKFQVLLGATGTGKTFTIANVINSIQKKTLVLAHNKTLASQLYTELKAFFPNNRVEYFVSYFDFYQPEAYISGSDTYIEKSSAVNEEIERMRHSTTASLFESDHVIIVSSVSCIYGLGSPVDYEKNALSLREGQEIELDSVIKKLVNLEYKRNNLTLDRQEFRLRGDVLEVVPMFFDNQAYRIEFFDDEIESIKIVNLVSGKTAKKIKHLLLFPASHYAFDREETKKIVDEIAIDLEKEVEDFKKAGKLIEAQRLEQRTKYDLEMMENIGYCNGIENYTRYLSKKKAGEEPFTLIDYLGDDWLLVIDESHVTIPQIRGMYGGDHSRKKNLVDHGFRLKAALDNRPLRFDEFEKKVDQVVFVSATPGDFEKEQTNNKFVEQIIRPTYLLDPTIEVRPSENQMDDIISEINNTDGKVLITTLTKRMAEDITRHLEEFNIKAVYLHSDITTIDRVKIINQLRKGKYDVLVGINLLREGLDIPEVKRVVILDADKQGFLRSSTALIQTIGRAARNIDGKVIMYADGISDAMKEAIGETNRRRDVQEKYNKEHNVKPITIKKDINFDFDDEIDIDKYKSDKKEKKVVIKELTKEMNKAADNYDFEKAAELRDIIMELDK